MRSLYVVLLLVVPGLCSAEEKCTAQGRTDILLVIDSAVKASRLIEPDDADWILLEAASYQACFRNYEQARKLASQIQDAEDRSYAYFSIAISYARQGDFAQAIPLADCTIRKSEVLEKIAVCQAEQGDYAGAQKTISLITEDLVHAKDWIIKADQINGRALLDVAILQAKAGNRDASLKMIDQAKRILRKFHDDLSVIGKLAEAYAYADDIEESDEWLNLLKKKFEPNDDIFSIGHMIKEIALGYATAQKYQMAFQIVKVLPDSEERGEAIHDIGLLLFSRGDEAGVEELLSITDGVWGPEELLVELVKRNVQLRQPDKALKYADQFEADWTQDRAQALLQIAALQQALKQPLKAEKTAQQAHQLIEGARSEKKLFAELLTDWAEYQLHCH
ncbi:MAG: hypothetical protein KDA74_24035, partial [Planctomycetaceae bacterium]|nr:hypothetical protein [Planctomycetaceae bacterium]